MSRRDILTFGVGALVALVVILLVLGSISHDMSGYRVNVLDEDPLKLSYTSVFKQVSAGNWSVYLSYRTLYISYIDHDDAYKWLVTCDYKCSATSTRIGNFFVESTRDTALSAVFDLVANDKYHAYVKFVNGEYQVAFPPNE
jgi:hypothetical protein